MNTPDKQTAAPDTGVGCRDHVSHLDRELGSKIIELVIEGESRAYRIAEMIVAHTSEQRRLAEIGRLAIEEYKHTEAYVDHCDAQIDLDVDNTSEGTMHAKDVYDRMSAAAEKTREAIEAYLSLANNVLASTQLINTRKP